MLHDLFTVAARESICRYFSRSSDYPLTLIAASEPSQAERTLLQSASFYAYRFKLYDVTRITDADVWTYLVAEVIRWRGGIGTPARNAVMDIVCVKGIEGVLADAEAKDLDSDDEDPPEMPNQGEPLPPLFIEPFFMDHGRKLIREHHKIEYRGPMADTGPRDCDLWHEFIQAVARARRRNNAAALGAFLVGPYAVLGESRP